MKSKITYVLIGILVTGLVFPLDSFADVISPKKQIQLQITSVQVSCKQGLVKVIKTTDNSPACVKPSTAEKLVKLGWAKQVDPNKIQSVKMRLQEPPLGEIKKVTLVKQYGEAGRLETTPRTVGYNFIFDACAFEKTIKAPQVLINSDSESKQIQLPTEILANSCQTSVIIIKAIDPDSIKGTLTNKGKITDQISEIQNKISSLQKQIADEKIKLISLVGQEKTNDLRSKVSESSKKIVDLRAQLNIAKGEYNTYLFALHVNPKTLAQFKKPLDFEGAKIEGVSISTLETYRQIDSTDTPYGYNVVFEVCSKDTVVRVPQVKITSDVETTIVNLADKIPNGTCQKSIGKIKADNPLKITYELGTSQKVSTNISDLQNSIDSLQKQLNSLREELSQLSRVAQKPTDYEFLVSELTDEIVDVRNKINANKAQLAQYQFQFIQ